MKLFVAMTVGSIAFASTFVSDAGAAPPVQTIQPAWNLSGTIDATRVDSGTQKKSQQEGIVNERSTGNEPFMGPGASGGPSHSAPGATENTVKEQSKHQGGMGQGGSKSGKSGGPTAKADQPGSEQQHGSGGSGSAKSGMGR